MAAHRYLIWTVLSRQLLFWATATSPVSKPLTMIPKPNKWHAFCPNQMLLNSWYSTKIAAHSAIRCTTLGSHLPVTFDSLVLILTLCLLKGNTIWMLFTDTISRNIPQLDCTRVQMPQLTMSSSNLRTATISLKRISKNSWPHMAFQSLKKRLINKKNDTLCETDAQFLEPTAKGIKFI